MIINEQTIVCTNYCKVSDLIKRLLYIQQPLNLHEKKTNLTYLKNIFAQFKHETCPFKKAKFIRFVIYSFGSPAKSIAGGMPFAFLSITDPAARLFITLYPPVNI